MLISQEELNELYPSVRGYSDIFYKPFESDDDLIQNYLPSKLWRLNNLYTITDKDANRCIFKMNRSQHKVYSASLQHSRLIILKSRQQGISTLWLISFFDDAIFKPDFKVGLMAQGTDEAATLLTRVKLAWEEFPESIKEFLGIRKAYDNRKEFAFNNKSNIFIRVSFRSATLQRLHISELGKIANEYPKRAKEVKTGSLQTLSPGNTGIIESTAEGDNMFKHMWHDAIDFKGTLTGKDFKPVFLSWLDDPDCLMDEDQEVEELHATYFSKLESELKLELSTQQKNFWIAQHRELGDEVYQEYPATPEEAFRKNLQGAYYAHLYNEFIVKCNRLKDNLYDPNLDVHVAYDLGRNDSMVAVFFQTYDDGYRIIDEYVNSGKKIAHYCDVMRKRNYHYGTIVLPHDGKVTNLNNDDTREDEFNNQGFHRTKINPRVSNLMDKIENVRQVIPERLWIDSSCTSVSFHT